MELLDHVAAQIRYLRMSYNEGKGISQEALARELEVAANTISRWETGVYLPGLTDLEKLTRFFNVPITIFFPPETNATDDENLQALLRTARQLHPDDLEELRKYAEFRKARRVYEAKNKPVAGRKTTKHK
jgi:transcriptional regulator with XRE-family HTH domain